MQPSLSPPQNLSDKSFTQNWLQSLTLVAQNTIARQLKPLLDSINDLCRINGEADQLAAAHRLWDFAAASGLQPLVEFVPVRQTQWRMDQDEVFLFERKGLEPITSFDDWAKCIGLMDGSFDLLAQVTSADWLNLVRSEAVRLQKSLNSAAMPAGINLSLPCNAKWKGRAWSIGFDQVDWIELKSDEPVVVPRVPLAVIEESLWWMMASANESLIPKQTAKTLFQAVPQDWTECSPRLAGLHHRLLEKEKDFFHPWFRRSWACVWTVIYREQNVLRGLAQLEIVRKEMAECIGAVPQLTLWMFVMAKLVCECQLGRGLGINADYASGDKE